MQKKLPDLRLSPFLGADVAKGGENPHRELAYAFITHLLTGKRDKAAKQILDAVNKEGIPVKEIYLNVFQNVLYEIGRLWEINLVSVAEEHYCTAATQLIMSQLYPHIFTTARSGYNMVATCVGGELHEIGIRMVADFFEMEGWDTYYLGANIPIDTLVDAIGEKNASLLAISATMTYHVKGVEEVIRAVRADQDLTHVQILVGGYPFTIIPDLWKEIGADGYGVNAQDAISTAQALVTTPSCRA